MTLVSDPPVTRDAAPAAVVAPASARPAADTSGAVAAEVRLPYRPGLDGVRALALIGVLCLHGGFPWARGGFLWVSTFFTLSGYLVTSLVMAEHARTGGVSLRGFWARRARRLLPAALVTLAGAAAYGAWLADASQLHQLRGDGLAALLDVANWRFIASGSSYASLFSSPSPVQHFWSLSIEEQWYLVFPLVVVGGLALGRRWWPVVGALFGVLAAAGVAWTTHLADGGASVERLYYGTDTRLAELALGALVAVVLACAPRVERALRPVAVAAAPAALAAMAFMTTTVEYTDRWLYPGGLVVWTGLSLALILGALRPSGPVGRGLSLGALRYVGTRSYGAYLVHWLVFLAVDDTVLHLGRGPLFGVRVAITFVVAEVVFRALEQPVRRRRLVTAAQARVVVPVAMVTVAGAFVVVTRDVPPAVSLGGEPMAVPESVPVATRRVLVVGDSQAWVLGKGMVRWADTHPDQASVWNVAVEGCGIVRGGDVEGWDGGVLPPDCDAWPERWTAALDEYAPDVVVVLSGPWDRVPRRLPGWDAVGHLGEPAFDEHVVAEYRAAAELLSSRGARVVWLTSPCSEWDAFVGDDPGYVNEVLLPRVAAAVPSMRVHDLFTDLCPDGSFTDELGGLTDARPDGIHLSDPAADWVASGLLPEVLAD